MDILKFINNDKRLPKNIILTHGDADGLSATMIIETAIKKLYGNKFNWIVISSLSPTQQETEKMLEWIFSTFEISTNDKIYIVDRAMPTIKYLDLNKSKLERAILISIDHHLTNHPDLWRKTIHSKYISFIWDDEECATTLALEWFKEKNKFDKKFSKLYESLKEFAEVVKLWDIFAWTKLNSENPLEKEKIIEAQSINAAEKLYGSKYFYKKISENSEDIYKIKDDFKEMYEVYQYKYESSTKMALLTSSEYLYGNQLIKIFYDFEKEYQSIFSYEILKNTEADILIFINSYGTASLKSRDNIDVSKLSKELGEITGFTGGGHKNASGCKFVESKIIKEFVEEKFINILKANARNKKIELKKLEI